MIHCHPHPGGHGRWRLHTSQSRLPDIRNLFYDHEFTEIKKIGAPASGREGSKTTSPHQSPAKILGIFILYKFLNENIDNN